MKKQHQMFRECPYEVYFESNFDSDCRNCPNYGECVKLRHRQSVSAAKMQKTKDAVRNRFIAICSFVALATVSITAFAASLPMDTAKGSPESQYQVVENSDVVNTTGYSSETDGSASDYYVLLGHQATEVIKSDEEVKETVSEETIPIVLVPEISAYGPGNRYYYDLNESEKMYLAMMVYKEARGESFEGKVAVVAVALNRYYSDDSRFDRRSIYHIVTQSGQFADISNVTKGMLDANPECMEAVEAACKGWDPTRTTFEDGALFFYSPKNISAEAMKCREGVLTLTIGNHNFHVDFNNKCN